MANDPDATDDPQAVQALVEELEEAGDGQDEVCVADLVESIGDDGLAAMILVPALIMITPASGIPGLSTACALIILLAATQMAVGREMIWLPGLIRRQTLAKSKLDTASRWIQKPASWMDRLTRKRLTVITRRPFSLLPLAVCIAIAAMVPVFEVVPFSASLAGAAIAFIALGLVARDGLLIILGLLATAGVVTLVWMMAT